jgi:carboxymethylenebutenolidase
MTIRWETTHVDGKPMRCYMATPDDGKARPGIVVAMHGPGLDDTMFDAVHRLHRAGYAAILPDLFHRQPKDGVDMMARIGMLKDEEIVADMNAAAALLKAQPAPVGPLGVTGFCMGGRITYLMSTANPEFKAAAVFYGGGIMKPWGSPPTPFERSKDIACPMIGFFGATDTNPTVEDVRTIDAELTRLGKWHEFHVYQDTGHAFQNFLNPDRYRERAARASWGELEAFFDHFLIKYPS